MGYFISLEGKMLCILYLYLFCLVQIFKACSFHGLMILQFYFWVRYSKIFGEFGEWSSIHQSLFYQLFIIKKNCLPIALDNHTSIEPTTRTNLVKLLRHYVQGKTLSAMYWVCTRAGTKLQTFRSLEGWTNI